MDLILEECEVGSQSKLVREGVPECNSDLIPNPLNEVIIECDMGLRSIPIQELVSKCVSDSCAENDLKTVGRCYPISISESAQKLDANCGPTVKSIKGNSKIDKIGEIVKTKERCENKNTPRENGLRHEANATAKLDNWLDFPIEKFVLQPWYSNGSSTIPLSPFLDSNTMSRSPAPCNINIAPISSVVGVGIVSDSVNPEVRLLTLPDNPRPPGPDVLESIIDSYCKGSLQSKAGLEIMKFRTKACNWKEYKLELIDGGRDRKIHVDSPASILWSDDVVTPLVKPWMASSTGTPLCVRFV